MTVTEKQRHDLFAKAEEVLGPDSAATMMELLAPRSFADLATKADLQDLARQLRTELAELRTELAEVRTELAEVRTELRGELRTELRGELRGELERYATKADLHEALHRQTRTFVTWLLASQAALIALVVVAIAQAG